jgi:hypothetical protein
MSHMNRELQMTIQASLREAMARRHAYLTVEHLLYALAHDDAGAEVLRNVGVDVAKLTEQLAGWLEHEVEKLPEGKGAETVQTLAFHRVLESALSHADSAEKEEVEAGDLLAAILQEPESQAMALLREQEVTRLDVLRFVSHGESKLRPKPPAGKEREVIQAAADAYLDNWGEPTLPVPHGTPCSRLEGRMHITTNRNPELNACEMGAFPQKLNVTNRRYVIDETVGAVAIFHNFPWLDAGIPVDPGTPASQTFRVEGGMNRYIHEVTACTTPGCGRGGPPGGAPPPAPAAPAG